MARFIERFFEPPRTPRAPRCKRVLEEGAFFPKLTLFLLLGALGVLGGSKSRAQESLLAAPQLPPYRWFASTDPQNKNADYINLRPGETRRIPLTKGRLVRLWSTAFEPNKIVLLLQNGRRTELLRGGRAQQGQFFNKAFTLYPDGSTPAAVRDLQNGATLVATNTSQETNKWFYQVSVRPVKKEIGAPPEKISARQHAPRTLKPGAEAVLLDEKRAGFIREISLSFQPATFEALRYLRLQARWDTGAKPALDVPLLALTGQFYDARPVGSSRFRFDGKTITLNWEMPYGPGARVTLLNTGGQRVSLQRGHIVVGSALSPYRFHARSGSVRVTKEKPVPILSVTGSGAFVGLAMAIEPAPGATRRTFAYLEGNETITADDQVYEGTGTEDFFNSAWYFAGGPFARPFAGLTFKSPQPPKVSMYRLMIPDAVPFKKSFKFDFEHGNGNNSNDLEFRWVAFWYQKPPLQFAIEDTMPKERATGGSSSARGNTANQWIWAALGAGLLVVITGIFMRLKKGSMSAARRK